MRIPLARRARSLLPSDAKAMLTFTASGSLQSLIGIISGPLILRKAGLAQFGYLGLAVFIFGLCNTLADFGIPAHLIALTSRPGAERAGVADAFALKAAMFVAMLALFLGYSAYYPHPHEAKLVAAGYLLVILFSAANLEWVFISERRHRELAIGRVAAAVLTLACLLGWYFLGSALWFVPVGGAAGQAAELAYLGWRLRERPPAFGLGTPSFARAWAVLRKVAPMAAVQVVSPFFLANGIFLMQKQRAPEEWIGAYNVSQRVLIGWLGLAGPFILFLIPKLAREGGYRGARKLIPAAAGLTVVLAVVGSLLIGIFYAVARSHIAYLGFSLRVYAILMIGLFLNLARLQAVSYILSRGAYRIYGLIHFVGVLPGIAMALAPAGMLPIGLIPFGVSIPEAIATVLALAWAGRLARRGGPRDSAGALRPADQAADQ